MLLRVLLITQSAPTRRRLARLCDSPEVLLSLSDRKGGFWPAVKGQVSDLILAGRAALPQPWADTIRMIRELPEQPEVVIIASSEEPAQRAAFQAMGCMSVIYENLPDDVLRDTLLALIKRRREQAFVNLNLLPDEPFRLSDFASDSPAMQSFLQMAQRVVGTDTSLLIEGETGVGKERLASAIHREGPRAAGPFIAVNCGAFAEGLLESELFGHEEGAFTGATRARRGYFELAHRGTIFLDEVGEMPTSLQVKLLRVLQERVIQRLGGERPIPLDVRIMAATNRNLTEEVRHRRFRQDLYYRLSVVTLTIPPLRERAGDIPALVRSYIQHFREKLGRDVIGASPEAMAALERYQWPGNVRELINVVERAVLLCSGKEITLGDLPEAITGIRAESEPQAPVGISVEPWLDRPWKEAREYAVGAFERAYFEGLLRQTHGRIGETAQRAGIDPRSLHEKMRRHGLHKEDYRQS